MAPQKVINNIMAPTARFATGERRLAGGFQRPGLAGQRGTVPHAGDSGSCRPPCWSGAGVGKFVVKLPCPIVDPARGAWAGISFPGRPCRSGWFAHGFATPSDTVWLARGGEGEDP